TGRWTSGGVRPQRREDRSKRLVSALAPAHAGPPRVAISSGRARRVGLRLVITVRMPHRLGVWTLGARDAHELYRRVGFAEPRPSLVGHPTFCVRYKGDRFYPESIPKTINVRAGLDAGKDIQLGVPVCPGDSIEVRSTLHEVYEKTGRTGSMYFVVIRFIMTNQRGEMLAVVDNRFMHR